MRAELNLSANRLLAALPAAEQQRWLTHLEAVDLEMGQVLYESGRAPGHAYFPTEGIVSLQFASEAGDCDEFAVIGREGVVGVALFMGSGSSTGRAVVQTAGKALRIRAQTLREEFERSGAVKHLLLRYTMALGAQVAQTAVCNRRHSVEQRLCRRLLQGLDRQSGSELEMTQEQLAGLLGVRRESITIEALKLQKAGVLSYSRGHIRVRDREGLEKRSCECHSVVETEYQRLAPTAALAITTGATPREEADESSLAGLATHLQQVRDQERGDLARELHDELGSLLTCAKLDVAGLKSRIGGGSPEVDERLRHLVELINSGIAFSRRVVEGLHPSSLHNLGLSESLQILARDFGQNTGIGTQTRIDDANIDETSQLAVYRVVQESLNNISKYAGASDACIALVDCGSEIIVTVRDNGKGFDTEAPGTSSHGLAGMRHRVESCGGQFTVSSEPGRGTVVAAVMTTERAEEEAPHHPMRAGTLSQTGGSRRVQLH